MNRVAKKLALAVIVLVGHLACGGDSGDPALAGRLVDSAVSGMGFATESQSGVTDSGGGFKYLEGETITFTYRGVEVGSALATPTITPIELAANGASPASAGAAGDSCLVEILRFLQTLDADEDHSNGISLPDGADVLEGVLCDDAFETLLARLTERVPISSEEAEENFEETLANLTVGTWEGTVEVDATGTWNGVVRAIEDEHDFVGCYATDEGDGVFACPLEINPATGVGVFSECVTGEWIGAEFSRTGLVEGDWVSPPLSGTFSGRYVSNSTEIPEACLMIVPPVPGDCETACGVWAFCTEWDYDDCIDECEEDGDWDDDYVECLTDILEEDACDVIEEVCG